MPDVFLVIGLGNPGREYVKNRHNVGFMLLNRVADDLSTRFSRLQANSLIAHGILQEKKVILAKPQTYMNLSGKSVRGLVRFYKLPLENIIIAHDDLDLPLGTIRIRPDGGSGGQKGLHSVLDYLETDQFPRIRMGIGRPPSHMSAPDYVLQNFTSGEISSIDEMLSRSVNAVKTWIREGLDACMNLYNRKTQE